MTFNFSYPRLAKKLLLLSYISVLMVGCSEQSQPNAHGGMPPANVSVITMTPQNVPFTLELPATLSGSKEVEIRARVAGILESRNFSEGDRIEAGESLFTLDLKPFELDVALNRADEKAAVARLERAEREVKRLKALRKEKTVSQRDYDDAVSNFDISQADLLAAQTKLREAELNLQYAKVNSPVSGIVGRERVSEGTFIPGPEVLLTEMTQLDPVRVRFGLSEREQLAMRQDEASGKLSLPQDGHWQTRIKLQDGSFYPVVGVVNFRDVRINTQTGTSELQAIVANPDFKLRPGQFVRVLLEGAVRKNTFVVPQRAVLDSGTGKYVYVMVKNEQGQTIAKQAPVGVGEWVQFSPKQSASVQNIENGWIIREGLKEGDQVIVDGLAKIFFPGAPVTLASSAPASTEQHTQRGE